MKGAIFIYIKIFIALFLVIINVFIAWYEGSGIIEDDLSWHLSTPVTDFFNIHISSGKDILILDYFYYSLKNNPLYLIIALAGLFYIYLTLSLYLFRNKLKYLKLSILLVIIICLMGILLSIVSTSLKLISLVFLMIIFTCLYIFFNKARDTNNYKRKRS